jgi:hypothetical protein
MPTGRGWTGFTVYLFAAIRLKRASCSDLILISLEHEVPREVEYSSQLPEFCHPHFIRYASVSRNNDEDLVGTGLLSM